MNTLDDLEKIQHGSYPASYVESVLESIEYIMREYAQLQLYMERLSCRERHILKSMLNRMYGSKVL